MIMKRIILIIALLVISAGVRAQITQISNINSYNVLHVTYNTKSMAFTPDHNTIEIYSKDFLWEKRISNLPTFDNIHWFTKNLFTLSGKYEFVLNIKNASTNKMEYKLYNEDGQLLYDFGEWQPGFSTTNKLFAYLLIAPGDGTYYYNIKVYSLQGFVNVPENPNINISKSIAFPNPADNFININYSINKIEEMQIIDIKGSVIENILLDPSLNTININTSNYTKGMYIYKLKGTNGKFIVK